MGQQFKVWVQVERQFWPDENENAIDFEDFGDPDEAGCFKTEEEAVNFAADLMASPQITIHVFGGAVSDVVSSVPLDYTVVDHDSEGSNEEDLVHVESPQPHRRAEVIEAMRSYTQEATVDAGYVERTAKAVQKERAS